MTVESRHMRVPVSLSYHGGIKAQDRASWIGLGWSLQAGGVITRVARGWPDDEPLGFLDNVDYVNANIWTLPGSFLRAIAEDEKNAEPDIYTISTPTVNGRFIFYSEDQVHMLPKQNVKITVQKDQQGFITGFTVTDESGIVYVFDQTETTSSMEQSSSSDFPPGKQFIYNSSWYLSSMSYPSGDDVIEFDYQNSVGSGSTTTRSNSYWKRINMPGYQCSSTGVETEGWKTTIVDTAPLYLHKIRVKNGQNTERMVEFFINSRTDLSSESRLDSLVYSHGSERKRAFVFTQENSGGSYPRMMLTGVQEEGNTSSDVLAPYSFTYQSGSFPDYQTNSIDH
jgi:hypothetical protein